jgi:hypothetical protein
MAYVGSDDIMVFPTTRRDATHRSSRLISEQSLVSIINQLVNTDAFVISSAYADGDDLEFNIHGYYFKINDHGLETLKSALNNPNAIWATIELVTTAPSSQGDVFVELGGQDDNNEYQGVVFSNTAPASAANRFSLKVLAKSEGVYVIPRESQIRFNADMVFDDLTVDGGVIS